jgi:peptide/nickel transport system ATP-binding protein
MTPLLDVRDLQVCFGGEVEAVRGVSFSIEAGKSLALVGESGSGKSTIARSIVGLVQAPEARGSVRVAGLEVIGADNEALRDVRWSVAALALQGAPFNPVATVGDQIIEPLVDRGVARRRTARERALALAEEVALDPGLLDRYPHELSGGERRRATLAMTLVLDPALVILDEPTAGLDPATRQEVVGNIRRLAELRQFGLLVIAHDLPDAAALADRTIVLYAGEAMEDGDTPRVMGEPAHPYSSALVNAYPVMSTTKDLRPIRGRPPDARAVPGGCPYHPRCTQAEQQCRDVRPSLEDSRGRLVACHFGGLKELLRADAVSKTFHTAGRTVCALTDVTLFAREGESVGVIGPSGSGKSTLARILTGHLAPDAGRVVVGGTPMPSSWRGAAAKALRRKVQLVMQDPSDALSPRLTVEELVREPLDLGDEPDRERRNTMVAEALYQVGLPDSGAFLASRAHELSGGQLQRIALARALVLRPKILVADEPTAMLDASEQARLLVVLRERQIEMGLGLVFVSHDMAVIRKVVDRIVVLDAGRVVEQGPSQEVAVSPRSTTGRQLMDAAPSFTIVGRRDEEIPDGSI